MPGKVVTLIIIVDLECYKCKAKIQKVLCKLQKCEPIDKIVYDEKNNAVLVSGTFDPECLTRKLRCKACKIIKEIKLKPDPPPPPPPPEKKPDPPPPEKKPDPPPPEKKPDPPPPEKKPDPPPEKKPDPPPPEKKPDPPPPEKKPDPPPPEKKPDPPPPEKKPSPPPPQVLKVDWQWPSSPPPWSVCCMQPCSCYHAHQGCSRCCSCGKVADPPPQPYPYPAPYYYPVPGGYGGHCDGVKIVCEQDPPYTCNIM